jgi:hypothetical protein
MFSLDPSGLLPSIHPYALHTPAFFASLTVASYPDEIQFIQLEKNHQLDSVGMSVFLVATAIPMASVQADGFKVLDLVTNVKQIGSTI